MVYWDCTANHPKIKLPPFPTATPPIAGFFMGKKGGFEVKNDSFIFLFFLTINNLNFSIFRKNKKQHRFFREKSIFVLTKI